MTTRKTNRGRRARTENIFIGGKIHPDTLAEKQRISGMVEVVENCITENGFGFFFHPLRDLRVWGGNRPPAASVFIEGKKLSTLIESVAKIKIDRICRHRFHVKKETLVRDLVLSANIHDYLRSALGGIFLLTEESFGCGYEIGILRQAGIPVLVLSDIEKHLLPSILLGDPSESVETKLFTSHEQLREHVDLFLKNLRGKVTENTTVRIPGYRRRQIEQEAAQKESSVSAVINLALDEHFEGKNAK